MFSQETRGFGSWFDNRRTCEVVQAPACLAFLVVASGSHPMTSPAVQEHCPECNATEGRPCVDLEGREMSGVHARRVWLFESLEAAEAATEEAR